MAGLATELAATALEALLVPERATNLLVLRDERETPLSVRRPVGL